MVSLARAGRLACAAWDWPLAAKMDEAQGAPSTRAEGQRPGDPAQSHGLSSQMKPGLHRFRGPKFKDAKTPATMASVAGSSCCGVTFVRRKSTEQMDMRARRCQSTRLCRSSAPVDWVRRPAAFTKPF